MEQEQKKQEIQIKLNETDLKGVYSNAMQISHTKEEFVLDFLNILPPTGTFSSRIIVSPTHLKRILATLDDNLKKYEEVFGKIEQTQDNSKNIGFKP